jgi:hypothetical protein
MADGKRRVMHKRREQFDRDRFEAVPRYSDAPTSVDRYDVNCSSCNQTLYVSRDVYEQVVNAVEKGLDNPFICDDCRDELSEMEHQGH